MSDIKVILEGMGIVHELPFIPGRKNLAKARELHTALVREYPYKMSGVLIGGSQTYDTWYTPKFETSCSELCDEAKFGNLRGGF